MSKYDKALIFIFFFVSGFCGLLYEIVWTRIAYSYFGIITPVMSVVIAMFMLGLSVGSWVGGEWIGSLKRKFNLSAIYFYAFAELIIGCGALTVPFLFSVGDKFLLGAGESNSFLYLIASAFSISVSVLPFCLFMGFTIPFMMSFVKEIEGEEKTSFSYLYLANVLGAMLGALITSFILIELFGFRMTLIIAAGFNFFVALVSFFLGRVRGRANLGFDKEKKPSKENNICTKPLLVNTTILYTILFMTGFTSMAMEVIWVRLFTILLNTRTYSFALILVVYLFATWWGTFFYRTHLRKEKVFDTGKILIILVIFAFFPLILNDPRMENGILMSFISIFPFCVMLGYLTPKLIDEVSLGDPKKGGRAYALNVLGSILGPLAACYLFLPFLGIKISLIILSLPFLVFFVIQSLGLIAKRVWLIIYGLIALCLLVIAVFHSITYEEVYRDVKGSIVRRDYTATVVAVGEGMDKQLLINGVGMTKLLQVTKDMAHLPLIFHQGQPESALVICFGMGTTFRSLMSWGIKATAVELVPSVKEVFPYFYYDAEEILNDPKGRIIIDDGRRFLRKTEEQFDVITLDPSPPPESAGSSLLYSEEFYGLVKKHLKKGGIFQQWFPGADGVMEKAVARSLVNSFPYVKIFQAQIGWGFHYICSMEPIQIPTVEEFFERVPKKAQKDIIEWKGNSTASALDNYAAVFYREISIDQMMHEDQRVVITDDRPYNEYFFIRKRDFIIKRTIQIFSQLLFGSKNHQLSF